MKKNLKKSEINNQNKKITCSVKRQTRTNPIQTRDLRFPGDDVRGGGGGSGRPGCNTEQKAY